MFPEELVLAFEKLPVFFKLSSVSIQNGIEWEERIYSGVIGGLDFVVDQLLELGWESSGCGDEVVAFKWGSR